MYEVSLKHIEPNGRDNNLKIASFLVFFILKFEAQFLQGIMGKI